MKTEGLSHKFTSHWSPGYIVALLCMPVIIFVLIVVIACLSTQDTLPKIIIFSILMMVTLLPVFIVPAVYIGVDKDGVTIKSILKKRIIPIACIRGIEPMHNVKLRPRFSGARRNTYYLYKDDAGTEHRILRENDYFTQDGNFVIITTDKATYTLTCDQRQEFVDTVRSFMRPI